MRTPQHTGQLCFARSARDSTARYMVPVLLTVDRQPHLQGVAYILVPGGASETDARVAVEGDTVTVQYKCMNSNGEVN